MANDEFKANEILLNDPNTTLLRKFVLAAHASLREIANENNFSDDHKNKIVTMLNNLDSYHTTVSINNLIESAQNDETLSEAFGYISQELVNHNISRAEIDTFFDVFKNDTTGQFPHLQQ